MFQFDDESLMCRLRVFADSILRGPFDVLMTRIRNESKAGLHIAALEPQTFLHFLRVSAWFMHYVRVQQEAKVAAAARGGEAADSVSAYACVSSIMCWDMVSIILRVWLMMVDTADKVKTDVDWDLQEVSIKVLRYSHCSVFFELRTEFRTRTGSFVYH